MGCDTYTVLLGNVVCGSGMAIDHAMLFAKALFNEYWSDPGISVTIKKEVRDA